MEEDPWVRHFAKDTDFPMIIGKGWGMTGRFALGAVIAVIVATAAVAFYLGTLVH